MALLLQSSAPTLLLFGPGAGGEQCLVLVQLPYGENGRCSKNHYDQRRDPSKTTGFAMPSGERAIQRNADGDQKRIVCDVLGCYQSLLAIKHAGKLSRAGCG